MKKNKDPGFGYSSKKNKKVFQMDSFKTKAIKFDVKFEASPPFKDSGFTLVRSSNKLALAALKD